jgi:DNA polymerase alpha subunit A
MDAAPAPSTTVTRKRKPSPDYSYLDSSSPVRAPSSVYRRPHYGDTSSDGPLDDGLAEPLSDDLFMSPKKKAKMSSNGDMTPATERLAQLDVHSDYDSAADMSFDDLDMDAFMDVDDEEINGKPPVKVEPVEPITSTSATKKELDATPSWLSLYDSLSVAEPDTLGPLASSSNSASTNSSQISALEPDGSLRFYWLDYLEHEGKLYFVGKLKDKVSNAWVSCCVTVEGIQRNLFVLPREKRVERVDEDVYETDVIPTPQDVHSDFELIRKQIGVKSWKGKFVKRKYAFGEVDVPRGESQWLKVVYGFNGMFNFFRSNSVVICIFRRASDTDECREPKYCSDIRHEHQRVRASCSQEEDYGTMLVTNQESTDR